jgi:ribosomal protein L34E
MSSLPPPKLPSPPFVVVTRLRVSLAASRSRQYRHHSRRLPGVAERRHYSGRRAQHPSCSAHTVQLAFQPHFNPPCSASDLHSCLRPKVSLKVKANALLFLAPSPSSPSQPIHDNACRLPDLLDVSSSHRSHTNSSVSGSLCATDISLSSGSSLRQPPSRRILPEVHLIHHAQTGDRRSHCLSPIPAALDLVSTLDCFFCFFFQRVYPFNPCCGASSTRSSRFIGPPVSTSHHQPNAPVC